MEFSKITYPFKQIWRNFSLLEILATIFLAISVTLFVIGVVKSVEHDIESEALKIECMDKGYPELHSIHDSTKYHYFCSRKVNGSDEIIRIK